MPAGQGKHVSQGGADTLPTGQKAHVSQPNSSQNLPGPQGTHDVELSPDAKEPGGHCEQLATVMLGWK